VWLPADARTVADDWLDEHADFPNVAHDDQVDSAYAARVAIAHWLPQMRRRGRTRLPHPDHRTGEVDLMTVACDRRGARP
jgi:hypothetical protein